jgi:hypothetical protein
MMLEALVAAINEQQGTSFRLGDRFGGGEQGAFALVDAVGTRFVLKRHPAGWTAPFERARAVAERTNCSWTTSAGSRAASRWEA